MKTPFTEFILTPVEGRQRILRVSMLPFENKGKMIGFCLGLNGGESLAKVSMCVYTGDIPEDKVKTPKWYDECNGKIWANELAVN